MGGGADSGACGISRLRCTFFWAAVGLLQQNSRTTFSVLKLTLHCVFCVPSPMPGLPPWAVRLACPTLPRPRFRCLHLFSCCDLPRTTQS